MLEIEGTPAVFLPTVESDSGLFAGLYILDAEETAIGRVQIRRVAEGLLVTIQ